ncbi:MAG: hypothetical protein Q8P57_02440 [Candidatus Pacearchaeota archaeon]|nr:hypothetical protein [Candidatus Pacearchaeota archaeon]
MKIENLKKGSEIKIGNDEYKVEDFDIHLNKKEDGFEESKEIILTKIGEKPKVLLKQKYALRFNKKNKEMSFYKSIQEKDNFPEGFKFKQREMWTSYKEMEI